MAIDRQSGDRAEGRIAPHQSRRPRRVRGRLPARRGGRDAVRLAGQLRHCRLRSPGRGPHRPDHLRGRRRPGPVLLHRSRAPYGLRFRRPGGGRSHPGLELRDPEPGRVAECQHRRRGPGHGCAASRTRRRQADLPRLLVRKPPGRHLRQSFPNPRPRHGPRWRTRPGPAGRHRDRSTVRIPRRPAAGLLRRVHRIPIRLRLAPRRQPRPRPSRPWSPGSGANPLPAQGTSRRVGPAAVLWGAAQALYWPATWPDLAQALQAAAQGDGTDFLELSDAYVGRQRRRHLQQHPGGQRRGQLSGHPGPLPRQPSRPTRPSSEKVAPVFGLLDLYGAVQCAVWPVPATGTVGPLRASGSPPIVVVGSTGDPVTPYALGPVPQPRARPGRPADPGRRRAHGVREQCAASAPRSTGTSFR